MKRMLFGLLLALGMALGMAFAQSSGASGGSGGALQTPEQAALAAAGGQKIGGSVSVLGTWGGAEQDSFLAMVKPFEEATGVKVEYTGTRDLSAILTTRVKGGNPPDLAGLPNPGQMIQLAHEGALTDLSKVLDMSTFKKNYAKTWIDLGTVDNVPVGVFIKASVKGLIWYDPKVWKAKGYQIPKTWDDLMKLSQKMAASGTAPWCIGLESGAASGWPGTDWLEDIILRQDGSDFYTQWYQGKVKWTSPKIKKAWETWGKIVANPKMVYGGAPTMLTTNFGQVGDALFTNPPGCYMQHQASFITGFYTTDNPNLKAGTDYNFFPFPPFDPSKPQSLEIAGDLFGMFKDTPQARALIKYLTTPEAQAIWVKRGGAISPNKEVPLEAYPNNLSRRTAKLLTSASVVVFDGSDQMPESMNSAFYKAVLNYVQHPNNLGSILKNLDSVQKTAYSQ
jgi:alpha-glucoside transport system substrate-binding protein